MGSVISLLDKLIWQTQTYSDSDQSTTTSKACLKPHDARLLQRAVVACISTFQKELITLSHLKTHEHLCTATYLRNTDTQKLLDNKINLTQFQWFNDLWCALHFSKGIQWKKEHYKYLFKLPYYISTGTPQGLPVTLCATSWGSLKNKHINNRIEIHVITGCRNFLVKIISHHYGDHIWKQVYDPSQLNGYRRLENDNLLDIFPYCSINAQLIQLCKNSSHVGKVISSCLWFFFPFTHHLEVSNNKL